MYEHIVNTVNDTNDMQCTGNNVGDHSIRSSFAMALYLAKRAVSTIMLIGRWNSDAFLPYVRRQAQEFSAGTSTDMVSIGYYFTIPDLEEYDNLDLRMRNYGSFTNMISLNDPNAATAHCKAPT